MYLKRKRHVQFATSREGWVLRVDSIFFHGSEIILTINPNFKDCSKTQSRERDLYKKKLKET